MQQQTYHFSYIPVLPKYSLIPFPLGLLNVFNQTSMTSIHSVTKVCLNLLQMRTHWLPHEYYCISILWLLSSVWWLNRRAGNDFMVFLQCVCPSLFLCNKWQVPSSGRILFCLVDTCSYTLFTSFSRKITLCLLIFFALYFSPSYF